MGKIAMVVIGAMEEELQRISATQIRDRAPRVSEVAVLRSGVGKVNAALRVAEFFLTRWYPPEWEPKVCVVGTAGALAPDLTVGDVIITTDAMQHDVDASPVGFPRGTIPFEKESVWQADVALAAAATDAARELGFPVATGRVLSGDRFIADAEEKAWLREHLEGACIDMETAAIAHACAKLGIPWVGIRVVSDGADHGAPVDFSAALDLASERIARLLPLLATKL